MKVITIGSFKGGTGKTTLAAVLGTAFANRGMRARIIELETSTKPLARFEASRDFADLPRACVRDLVVSGGTPDVQDWQMMLRQEIMAAEREKLDVLIIDSVSVWRPEVIAAHLVADLVITTVTESPIDLYQLMPGDGPNMQAVRPYAQLIDLVRRHAVKSSKENFNWMLCINRRSHLRTKVGDNIHERLKKFTNETGMLLVDGLVDRVGYRNMMQNGITPLDEIAGEPLQKSQLAARTEVKRLTRNIIATMGLQTRDVELERA